MLKHKKYIFICIAAILLAVLGFSVLQSSCRYTADSNYETGQAACQEIWQTAERLAADGVITLDRSFTSQDSFGREILSQTDNGYIGGFAVTVRDGSIEYVLCSRQRRSLADEDIRIYPREEQIGSLSSLFTKKNTVFCMTADEHGSFSKGSNENEHFK